MSERTYSCQTSPATQTQQTVCDQRSFCQGGTNCFDTSNPADQDFGRAMASMEAAREAGVYGEDLRLFKGVGERCRKKLFGLVNCCKGAGSSSSLFSNLNLILGAGNTFMRSVKAGIDDYLRATHDNRKVPVVNLQCDIDHPTQTLADLMWLREYFPGGLKGKKIAMSWAYSPSYAKPLSVPQGIAMLMAREGAHVSLAHPEGYRLMDSTLETARKHAAESGGKFEVVHDMDEAFKGADVVYPKSWGPYDLMLERVEANSKRDKAAMGEIEKRALDRNASHKDWICDERRMALTTGGDALYMHCLPADIGDEVTPGVMAKHKVNVAREANKKMYIVMALLAVAKVEGLGAKLDEVLR